jgi:hypothetical protein
MVDDAFAAMTRRTSLVSLGATGLVAAFAGAVTAEAKNSGKKSKRKAQQKCQNQVGACEAYITAYCEEVNEGDPDLIQICLDERLRCCQPLATCDADTFMLCIGY